jgi:hypothetical protein
VAQYPGPVEVLNKKDEVTIALDANGGEILIKDMEGNVILRLGEVQLLLPPPPPLPPQKISAGSYVTLMDTGGQVRFHLSARKGQIKLGGNGASGGFLLFKGDDDPNTEEPSIRLDGQEADLRMASIHLDGGHGDIHLGGRGQQGNLLVYPAPVNDQSVKYTTIYLDGEKGVVRAGGWGAWGAVVVRGLNEKDRIRLISAESGIHLGGNGAYGNLFIYPSDGDNQTRDQATIHLDGQAGDIILQNADCAEDFDVPEGEEIEPGTVVVINSEGQLQQSTQAYDKKVAGVVSGAGDRGPGIVLGRQSGRSSRLPVALTGKVFCKVDARYSAVDVGDLLTTSPTPGYAMKAEDPLRAFGAVIGKALQRLSEGSGLIPILVALQ